MDGTGASALIATARRCAAPAPGSYRFQITLNARRHRRHYPNTARQGRIRFKPSWDRYQGALPGRQRAPDAAHPAHGGAFGIFSRRQEHGPPVAQALSNVDTSWEVT